MSERELAPQVAAQIASYRPRSVGVAAGAFARESVAAAAPASRERAQGLLFCASRLAAFGEAMGLELSAEALLQAALIERFVRCGTEGLSPASRRTLRTNLRALARALERHPAPAPVPLGRERAKPPHSDAEIEGFLRLAACQPTEARRMRCAAVVCLGAGAGIVAGELRHIRGTDVVERERGVLVIVRGKRARSVPVRPRFHEPLLAAARFAGDRFIVGGAHAHRRNVTDALTVALCADPSLPRLEAGRLRSTWLCACAQQIGLGAFMQAAGVRCSQRLGDLAAALPAAGEEELLALLGGWR